MTPTPPPRPRQHFGPTKPILWAFYDDEQRAETLGELTAWVDWLRWRFVLDRRVIPDCWDQHGAVVEELSALYTAWHVAYAFSDDGAAPLAWMQHFAATRHRLTEWNSRTACRVGEHRPDADHTVPLGSRDFG